MFVLQLLAISDTFTTFTAHEAQLLPITSDCQHHLVQTKSEFIIFTFNEIGSDC